VPLTTSKALVLVLLHVLMVPPPIRTPLPQELPQTLHLALRMPPRVTVLLQVLPQIVHRVLRLVLLPTALAFLLRVLPAPPLRKLVLKNRQPRGLCRRSCRNQVLRRRRSCRNRVLCRLCQCSRLIS
jgi:hypothetical protein